MSSRAKVVALVLGLLLIGFLAPSSAASAGLPTGPGVAAASAALPTGKYRCGWHVTPATPVVIWAAASPGSRPLGYVDRTWSLTGGPGCWSGYAIFATGVTYRWSGKLATTWARGTFGSRNGRVAISGWIPASALFRSCSKTSC